jgi:putative peptide zinc metalloprotease protein
MLAGSVGNGDFLDASVRVLAIAAVALPVLGIFYILLRLGRQLISGLWQKTRASALRRGTAITLIAAVVAGLGWAWWPGADTYSPVQPYERGTLADAATAVFPGDFPGASGSRLREGQAGRTVALWPAGTRKPTRDEPQLSLVMVPRPGGASATTGSGTGTGSGSAGASAAAPSWVFPFDRPAAPEGDGSQALAVNTTDGSVAYDVAFALVWADDGGDVRTRNEAYAFASCADCAAVAVGFQVVLVVGQADVVVPENLSAAANYNCVRCLTYALASQLVLTLDGPLSTDGTARLNALWQEIAEFGRNLQNVPLSEIQGRLNAYKEQIVQVIKGDPSAVPAGRGTTTTQTGSPTPGGTQSASPDPADATAPGPQTGGTASTAPAPAQPTQPGTAVTAPGPFPAPASPTSGQGTATQSGVAPAPAPGAASPPATTTPPPAP